MSKEYIPAPIRLDWIMQHKKEDIPEVLEIREKINSSFNDIVFKEDTHQYFLPKANNKELLSVSTMTHRFVPKVDWDEVCLNTANKIGVDFDKLKESWAYNNVKATNSGTHAHEYGESWFYFARGEVDKVLPAYKRQIEKGYFLPNFKKEEAIEKFYNWYFTQPALYGVFAETQVYTEKYGYAGTFDLLMYYKHPMDDTKSGLIIFDYKTNADIHNKFNRDKGNTLLPPFENFIDEAESHYAMQLSAYQIPLEDIGLKVIGRRLIWIKDDGTFELIKIPNLTTKLRMALGG